jgi:hypothetical protein
MKQGGGRRAALGVRYCANGKKYILLKFLLELLAKNAR